MLKKAGIIVAAAATGVLAVSSLAFASDMNGNLKNDCSFPNKGGAPTATADQGDSLLGALGVVSSLATDATAQANTANCNNVNVTDILDSDSNNRTESTTKTHVKDSYNTED